VAVSHIWYKENLLFQNYSKTMNRRVMMTKRSLQLFLPISYISHITAYKLDTTVCIIQQYQSTQT